jgi:hypothetical protein
LRRYVRRALSISATILVLLFLVIAVEAAIGWRCNLQGQIHPPTSRPAERQSLTAAIKGYSRPEDDTFLSYPEWYIVWSYQEKADYQQNHLPSGFPYFGAVRQYWGSYCCISRLIRGRYAFNGGEQLMLVIIGTSFSAEYILKGIYEKSLGRLSEWSSDHESTEEDQFAYKVAREYADFVHVRPFYEFRFARHVTGLWSGTHLLGAHLFRKWERKLFLTADYAAESFYCWAIEKLTHASYGYEPSDTYAWIAGTSQEILGHISGVTIVRQLGPGAFIVDLPRYQPFTVVASALAEQGAQFVEIAGNSQVLVSVLTHPVAREETGYAQRLFHSPVLTDPETVRTVMNCEVSSLSSLLTAFRTSGATLEHIYDY